MKKLLCISFFSLVLSSVGYANNFVSDDVINQFGEMNINGLTARQVADDAKNTTFTNDRIQIEVNKEKVLYQKIKDAYENAEYRERSLRNIHARDSMGYYSDPYDFMGGYGTYSHTLSFPDYNLHCIHSSVQGVNNHADAYIALGNAASELKNYNNDLANNRIQSKIQKRMWDLYGAEYEKKINEGLAPFKQKIIDKYKEDFDLINISSTKIKCQAITEIQKKTADLPIIPTFSYKHRVRCQDSHAYHSFECYVEESGIVKHGCECGHAIFEHEPTFKPESIAAKKAFLKHYEETKSSDTKESSFIKKLKAEVTKNK